MKLTSFLEKNGASVMSESTEKIIGNFSLSSSTVPSFDLPVSVDSSSWMVESNPERLVRRYDFKKFSHLMYFINESLRHQEHVQHHSKITIEAMSVTVETYTHDIDSITEQDINLSKYFDEIYSDVSFLDMDFGDE